MMAFVVVIGVAVVVMAFTSRLYINNIFDRYVEGYRSVLMEHWEHAFRSYYVYNRGSWEGVEDVLLLRPKGRKMFGPRGPDGMGYFGILPGERLLLADKEGRIVLDSLNERTGETIPHKTLERSTPIIHDGEQVGTLILQPLAARTVMTLEEEFSRSVLRAVIWGGIVALLAGAVLSYLLTRQVTRPLALLTASARRFARRDFQHRVQLKRKDEIGDLAEAFNFMASSIEKTEKLRSNLLADISHELRTPLTILRGNLEALQGGKIKPSPELISSLYDEVLRLGRLVSDLETINLAEAGKLPLHYREIEIKAFLSRATAAFQLEADERKIKFDLEVADNLTSWVLDEDRIIQVIINLLANAFKFTADGGKIKLRARKEKENLVVEVQDSGPGIPEKDLPFIFERFYKSSKERGDGSGLGLSIAKSFVEAHGGKITAANLPEGGSTFIFSIPLHLVEKQK